MKWLMAIPVWSTPRDSLNRFNLVFSRCPYEESPFAVSFFVPEWVPCQGPPLAALVFAQQNRRTKKQETHESVSLVFCDCPHVLLSALPPTARKGECEGGTFDGFPHSRSVTRPQATTFA